MDANQRQQERQSAQQRQGRPQAAGMTGAKRRSPVLARVVVEVEIRRGRERFLRDDELSDEEAEAFGFV